MTDTPQKIIDKQSEIFLAKPISQRFIIGLETIDFGYKLAQSGLRLENPGIADIDLKILLFKRFYHNYFSKGKEKEILNSIILYNEQKNQKI